MTITVLGTPAPQGSKEFKGMSRSGHAILAESSKKVKPWRISIEWAASEALGDCPRPLFTSAVRVDVIYSFERPKSVPKKRLYPLVPPDLDKLDRALGDALKIAGVVKDDALIVCGFRAKAYCNGPVPGRADVGMDVPGAVITVEAI